MSLAETGYAPSVFAYVDKSACSLWALVFLLFFGPFAYVNLTASGADIFNWLLALSGLPTLLTWGTICLCHIRFLKTWHGQGHSVEGLPFRAMFGISGSWAGLTLVILVLIAQFYIAISPVGGMSSNPSEVAVSFFQSYLALPVVVLFYIIGYVWKRTTPQGAHQIDLDVSPVRCLHFALPFSSVHVRLGGGILTAPENLYDRPAASVGTPSNRCANTAPSLLHNPYGRRHTVFSSRVDQKPTARPSDFVAVALM